MKKRYETDIDIDYIRKNVKLIRESKNLSQKEIATKLDVTIGAYQRMENGEILINMMRLHELAEIFGMSVVNIFQYPNIGADSERVKELENTNKELQTFFIHERLRGNELRIQLKEIDLEKAINEGVSQEIINYIKESIEFYKNEIVRDTTLLKSFGLKEITININPTK